MVGDHAILLLRRHPWAAAALIAAAGAAAYAGSFHGALQFDDPAAILDNPTIRHWLPLPGPFAPPAGALTVSGRPVLNASLALNYSVSGFGLWSYHALNLGIHLAAALTLFGLIRRTLAGMGEARAPEIALAAALLWTVHPLTTESVTYVVQRAESLAALFYLLTLYSFARACGAPESAGSRRTGWLALSAASCVLGMATKETVASAPLAVWLYDRTFVAGGWRSAVKARPVYYLALAAAWAVLIALVAANGWDRGATAGFSVGIKWMPYWRSQGEALARYLLLSFWPAGLSIDYGPPTAPPWLGWALFSAGCLAVAGAGLAAYRGRRWAFPVAVALLVLAPTSLVPGVLQYVSEHRMYLPLASVIVLAVCGASRLMRGSARLAPALVPVLAIALGAATWCRNRVYANDLALWQDAVNKRPLSATAQGNLGEALLDRGRLADAAPHCLESVRLDPYKPWSRYNLGMLYQQQERWNDALKEFAAAVAINPKMYHAAFQAGRLLDRLGRPAEAEQYLLAAIAAEPRLADAYGSLGVAEAALGRSDAAIAAFKESLRLNPDQPEVDYDLGLALARAGRGAEAAERYAAAARLRPAYWEAEYNLGIALAQLGRLAGARSALQSAVRLRPDSPESHAMLATVLDQMDQTTQAIAEYRTALKLRPRYAEAHYNLGNALLHARDLAAARAQFAEAVRLDPNFEAARAMVARLDAYFAQ